MPIKRPLLATEEIYHVVIRSIESLNLFRDKQDYWRMIRDLYEFNDEKPIASKFRVREYKTKKKGEVTRTVLVTLDDRKREKLVEILAFCLMPNHVHLLLRQIRDGGISKFMRKVGAGYGGYYNRKYKRLGHVFVGRYRIVHIANDNQLKTVFVYIHTNPVAIIYPRWKEKGIKTKDLSRVIKFLEEEYRWSSYPDYLGNKNFPSLTIREWLTQEIGSVKECRRFINDWLQTKKELADFDKVAIE